MFKRSSNMGGWGGIVEKDFFGSVAERGRCSENKEHREYKKYKDAMAIVKEMQIGDPTDPKTRSANDLHAMVAEKLGIEDYKNIRLYTAVGSHLDKDHGVDAFFEIDYPETQETRIVTLDITTNEDKDAHKADIIFNVSSEGLDPIEDKEEYLKILNEVSDRVKRKIERDKNKNKNNF